MKKIILRTGVLVALALLVAGCSTIANAAMDVLNGSEPEPEFTPIDPGPFDGPLAEQYAGQPGVPGEVVFSSAYIPYDGREGEDSTKIERYTVGEGDLALRFWAYDSLYNLVGEEAPELAVDSGFDPLVVYTLSFEGLEGEDGLPPNTVELGRERLADEYELFARAIGGRVFTTPALDAGQYNREDSENAMRRDAFDIYFPQLPIGTTAVTVQVVAIPRPLAEWSLEDPGVVLVSEGTIDVVVPDEAALITLLDTYGTHMPPSIHPEAGWIIDQFNALVTELNDQVVIPESVRAVQRNWDLIRNELTGLALYEQTLVSFATCDPQTNAPDDYCRMYESLVIREANGVFYIEYFDLWYPRVLRVNAGQQS